jgi:hypothetical protein
MTDKADFRTVKFAFEGRNHPSLVGLITGEAHFDQFVRLEGFVNGCEHRGRQAGLADLNNRFEVVSEATQMSALIPVELHAIDSIQS